MMMKTSLIKTPRIAVIVSAFFIYIWLTVLAELSVTDTYYSVYLLCAILFVAKLLSGTRIIPGTLSGIATTKNSKSKGNGAGGVGGNGLIFRYYRLTACG